jgi:gas vesicle structural protein
VSEVLDRVLDRGIVIDAWVRVSVAGIALIDVDARIVVASVDTYLQRSEDIARASRAAAPSAGSSPPRLPVAPRPVATRRPRVRLQCDAGCTFLRRASRRPTAVRCPAGQRRVCPVETV